MKVKLQTNQAGWSVAHTSWAAPFSAGCYQEKVQLLLTSGLLLSSLLSSPPCLM
jgi:hypothetical protein